MAPLRKAFAIQWCCTRYEREYRIRAAGPYKYSAAMPSGPASALVTLLAVYASSAG